MACDWEGWIEMLNRTRQLGRPTSPANRFRRYPPPPNPPPHLRYGTFQYFQNRSSIKKNTKKTLNEKEVFLKKNVFPDFVSRNVGNSIKCKKNITPPPPTFEIKKSEQGNRGYIGYRFPLSLYLLFGETTSHLTSK